jgi:hypothetical protein
MRDLFQELEDYTGEFPPAWKPEPGDILVGKVLHYDKGFSLYGEVRTCIVEQDDGERVSLWLNSTVLLDQFKRLRPRIGERIGLKYLGMHPERGYHRFKLLVDREEPLTFEPLGGEAKVPAGADDEDAPF